MTDGVAITAGSGTTIATDDAGASGQVQIVKLAIATDGSATPIPADASGILVKSATAANMLVTEASAAAILTSTQLVDDIVYVDDTATHSTGTSKGALIMAAATPTDAAVDVNDIGAVAMTTSRQLHVAVQSAVFAGTAATSLGKAADRAAGATDTGIAPLAIRDDALSTLTPVEGDYAPLRVNATGALYVTGASGATEFAEDSAHSSGHAGVMALAVREASPTDLSAGNTDGDYEPLQVDASGRLWVNVGASSVGATTDTEDGTIADGQSTVALTVALPYTWDGDNWTRAGASVYRTLDLDETEETVKTSGGAVLYGYYFWNASAATRYIKFYNLNATNCTVGSSVPVLTFPVPTITGGHIMFPAPGVAFSTAMSIACTTGLADASTGAPGTNDVVLNVFYK